MTDYAAIIRQSASPLEPIPTGLPENRPGLGSIKAVLFDVYGTMFISGSGDIGTTATAPGAAIMAACAALEIDVAAAETDCGELLLATIESFHKQSRSKGIEYPEVDIVAVWESLLAELARRGAISQPADKVDFARLAIEYEMRANPVWPMPHLRECLGALAAEGIQLGIISNAQFYTPLLFSALLEKTHLELGFSAELCIFSYQHGQAKPGQRLYELARDSLADVAVAPHEVLYIGNDMLKDVWPARSVGFKTALFAGDARSLRLREDDARVAGIKPDIIVNDLLQITTW